MNKKRKEILLIIFLLVLLLAVNYKFIDNAVMEFLGKYEYVHVERVIDGDTIVVENDTHVRLLGINTPEKGEKYYNEAKDFLEMVILNKTVKLEYGDEEYDMYGRKLAYLFYDNANVNAELVDEGYANFYFPSGKDKYYNRFVRNWEHCIRNNKYLCEKSEDGCAECIELKEFNIKKQKVVLNNNCSFDCDLTGWTIKDEGRKKFVFPNFILNSDEELYILIGEGTNDEDTLNEDKLDTLFWSGEKYVWTSTGDTLFLRDAEGKLVLWESY